MEEIEGFRNDDRQKSNEVMTLCSRKMTSYTLENVRIRENNHFNVPLLHAVHSIKLCVRDHIKISGIKASYLCKDRWGGRFAYPMGIDHFK